MLIYIFQQSEKRSKEKTGQSESPSQQNTQDMVVVSATLIKISS
jgi:hypothetical protein